MSVAAVGRCPGLPLGGEVLLDISCIPAITEPQVIEIQGGPSWLALQMSHACAPIFPCHPGNRCPV